MKKAKWALVNLLCRPKSANRSCSTPTICPPAWAPWGSPRLFPLLPKPSPFIFPTCVFQVLLGTLAVGAQESMVQKGPCRLIERWPISSGINWKDHWGLTGTRVAVAIRSCPELCWGPGTPPPPPPNSDLKQGGGQPCKVATSAPNTSF